MKKTVKILGLLAAAFVMGLGFVGCGDASIDDGTDIVDVNDGTSGKDDGSGDAVGIDTIGDSWGALFENKAHSPFDTQIWEDTADIDSDFSQGMKITAKKGNKGDLGWVGVVVCQKNDKGADAEGCVFYDMSKVAKMTFEVKASKALKATCVYTAGEGAGLAESEKIENVNATTEWQTVPFEKKGAAKAFSPFACVIAGTSAGDWIMIRNIKYLDSEGNSVALKYVEEQ